VYNREHKKLVYSNKKVSHDIPSNTSGENGNEDNKHVKHNTINKIIKVQHCSICMAND